MIEIQNLKKSFGEKCACDIPQLSIGSGEIIGLVGNNGGMDTWIRSEERCLSRTVVSYKSDNLTTPY